MDEPAGTETEPTIGDLVGRLADDGRAYVRAEIGLYQAIAGRRLGQAKYGVAALLVGALLVNAALIVLMIFVGLWIAIHQGPVIAGLIVAAVALVIAFFLFRFGAARMKALAGDAEEKAALAAVESAS